MLFWLLFSMLFFTYSTPLQPNDSDLEYIPLNDESATERHPFYYLSMKDIAQHYTYVSEGPSFLDDAIAHGKMTQEKFFLQYPHTTTHFSARLERFFKIIFFNAQGSIPKRLFRAGFRALQAFPSDKEKIFSRKIALTPQSPNEKFAIALAEFLISVIEKNQNTIHSFMEVLAEHILLITPTSSENITLTYATTRDRSYRSEKNATSKTFHKTNKSFNLANECTQRNEYEQKTKIGEKFSAILKERIKTIRKSGMTEKNVH